MDSDWFVLWIDLSLYETGIPRIIIDKSLPKHEKKEQSVN